MLNVTRDIHSVSPGNNLSSSSISSFCSSQELTTACDDRDTVPIQSPGPVFFIYYYGLLGLITVVNLAGNVLVIQCLVRHKHLRVAGNCFIFSLACSDLCLGLTYPIYNVAHMEIKEVRHVFEGWFFCTGIITIYLGLQSVSAYSLVGVAVTRFISIRNPLRFSTIVTRFRAIVSAVLLWTLLMVLSAILYFRVPRNGSFHGLCRYELFLKYTHILFTCVMSVIAPLVIMTILYALMAFEARKHVIAIAYAYGSLLGDTVGARRYIIKKELRMVAMAGALLGYFAFSWLPFVVYQFYTIHSCKDEDLWMHCEPNKYIRATVRLLLHSNSAVNFFIYSSRVKDFRESIQKDLLYLRCWNRGSHINTLPHISHHSTRASHNGHRHTPIASSHGSTLSNRTVFLETVMCNQKET